MAHPVWPLYDIVVRTPRLEARLPNEEEYLSLLEHVDESIYARAGIYPFIADWVHQPKSEAMRFYWRLNADWSPEKWEFNFGIFVDGELVGLQGLRGENFGAVRAVSSGSWLRATSQGQGLGKEMRLAVLWFAFEGLGALEAKSEAHVDNAASNAVSRSLGYEFTHRSNASFAGELAEQWNMILRRDVWESHPAHQRDDITIEGLTPVLDWFGVEAPGSSDE